MNTETDRILQLLKNTYAGDAWHGSPVREVLKDINAQKAAVRTVATGHTIWEIVKHLTAWRNFACQKLSGNIDFDITVPEQDWPGVEQFHESAWQADLQALQDSQMSLIHLLGSITDNKLNEIVPGRTFTFYVLLHGIIQHDLYHTGQIALLKKIEWHGKEHKII